MANSLGQSIELPTFNATATLAYTALIFRELTDILVTPGRRNASSLLVSQHAGTPNMSVDVSVGGAIVAGTTSGAADASGMFPQGVYGVKVTGTTTVTIGTAPGSGSRTDAIYLQVADKTVVGSGNDEAIIAVQANYTGTLPASSLLLATVVVATGTTQILNSMISTNNSYAIGQAIEDQFAVSPSGRKLFGSFPASSTDVTTTASVFNSSFSALIGHIYRVTLMMTGTAVTATGTPVAVLAVNGVNVSRGPDGTNTAAAGTVPTGNASWTFGAGSNFSCTVAVTVSYGVSGAWRLPANGCYVLVEDLGQ